MPTNRFGTENEQHFTEHAAALLQGLLLYVRLDPAFPEKERHLGTVYDLLSLSDDRLKAQLLLLSQKTTLALSYYGTAEREFSGITNTARKHLRFLESPAVRRLLQTTTFDLTAFTQGTTDLFLCLPPEHLESQFRLIRLFVSLVFTTFKEARGQRAPAPFLMVLDELPALEYIPEVENMLVYGRGYGVTLMGFAQTLELIQSLYPHTWRTFLSAAITIFFEASETSTADYVSHKLGTTTISQTSRTQSSLDPLGLGGPRRQDSTTHSAIQRPLLTPDEVAPLGPHTSLVFIKGHRPLLLHKPCYYMHQRWKGQWDQNKLEKN